MMMTHPSNEDLFAYRDGELDLEKRGLIEAHVLSCGACQARIDETSDAEAMLRQGLQDPSDAYFDRMTESVMGRVTGAAPATAGAAAKRPADIGGRPERVARRKSFDDGPRNRAPGLPWPAILSAASAAAAVMVVVVMLVQRQDVWKRGIAPETVGTVGTEERTEAPADDQAATEGEPPTLGEGASGDQAKDFADSPRESAAPEAKNDALGKLKAGAKVETPSPIASSGIEEKAAARSRGDEVTAGTAPEALLRKSVEAPSAEKLSAPEQTRDMRFEQQAPQASAPAAGSGFAELAARHRLPLLYDPARVTGSALLRAESDLRYLYQTGGAGEDSARVRLYLAEAARARAAGSYDSEAFDTIVHHYRRALGLARDVETARMVRRRLEDFVSQNAPGQ